MIPPFPNRLTGPAPAGGGTGILLRRAGQGSRRGRTRSGSPCPVAKISLFIPAGLLYNKIWHRAGVTALFRVDGPQGPGRAQWSRPTSIASAGRAGGHMGPPLRKIRSVIRHCEEGRRPDAAIRTFMQGERIPTAPPGPRNDGVGAQGAPQAAKGRPHEEQRTCCGRRPLIRPFGPPSPLWGKAKGR